MILALFQIIAQNHFSLEIAIKILACLEIFSSFKKKIMLFKVTIVNLNKIHF